MEISCVLECGHEITWGESPLMPGASLPYENMVVYCPECEEDVEIIKVKSRR